MAVEENNILISKNMNTIKLLITSDLCLAISHKDINIYIRQTVVPKECSYRITYTK
jgi:hypothetical protein